jgi:hypothetical protein
MYFRILRKMQVAEAIDILIMYFSCSSHNVKLEEEIKYELLS